MPSRFDRAITLTSHQDGQIVMSVTITVTNRPTIYHHRMIQQRAFAFRNGFQTLHEMSKQCNVIMINLGQRLDFLSIITVMRKAVMSTFHADHRIAPIRSIVRHEIGNHPR